MSHGGKMKQIEGFNGYYVTEEGKVYCDLGKGNRDRNKRVDPYELKPRVARNGYLRVYMRNTDTNKRVDKYVHRLVAENFIEKVEGKGIVNHKDCNRANNDKSNLEWVDYRENMEYAIKMGNLRRCESTGRLVSCIQ